MTQWKLKMEKENLIRQWQEKGIIKDSRVIEAFRSIPREEFVSKEWRDAAYLDEPLPIGEGQTISQPTTVMIMLDALSITSRDTVLEVGTGSGYCAALISTLARFVYTTEIIPALAVSARKNIDKLAIKNIEVIETDGSQGYAPHAPYDRIMVTAACPRIPPPLIAQVKDGGIIVAPVEHFGGQRMIRRVKRGKDLITESLGDFVFVPLRGAYGYKR